MDYISEAQVTLSNSYHGDKVQLSYFLDVVDECILAIHKLDNIKKTLFYGRTGYVPQPVNQQQTMMQYPEWINNKASAESVGVLHGIIGKVTEAGELLDALALVSKGSVIDKTNVIEEIGDGMWYDALLLNALNSSIEDAQKRNIAKLRKRFPNAYNEFDANNRDLFAEKQALQQGT